MKTLGQIAFEAAHPEWMDYAMWDNPQDKEVKCWEAAAQAVRAAVIEECAAIARDHSVHACETTFKSYEDTYHDGFQDASNEIEWAINALKDKK